MKISPYLSQVNKYKNRIGECKNINNCYLIFNYPKNTFRLISDCITENNQWFLVFSKPLAISFSSLEEYTKKTKEEILENLDDIINSIEIGKNYEIKGEDFTLTIRPINSSFND